MSPPTESSGPPRVLRAVVGTILFAVASPVLLFTSALVVSLSFSGQKGEPAGWMGLALAFVGAPVGAVVGLLISVFGPGNTWWRRCLITAGVLVVTAVILALSSIKR